MKNQTDMIALGLAALAVYFIVKPKTAGGAPSATGNALASMTKEIFDAATGKRYDNGWRYFSDGTAIDPYGNYYQGGQLIWTKPASSFPTSGVLPTSTNDGVWL